MQRWLMMLLTFFLLVVPAAAQTPTPVVTPPPQYATEETLAVIVYPRVNMRTQPSLASVVIDIAILGERFRIVGESDDGNWYLVEANGGMVWISQGAVIVTHPERIGEGDENPSPAFVDSVNQQVEFARYTIAVLYNANVRSGPGNGYAVVDVVPAGDRVFIQGRNGFGSWVYVNHNGRGGWMSIFYLAFPTGYRLDLVPIVR